MRTIILALVAMAAMIGGGLYSSHTVEAAAPYEIIPPKLSIEVLVDARKMKFPDARPKLVNNSVLVPIRFVSDKLGGKLSLVGRDITIVKGDRTIRLTIGSMTASINGKPLTLNAPANAYAGRTYVPLRFISEAFGESVEWDSVNQFVWIGSKDVPKLEDAIKPVDIEPYTHYYNGTTWLKDLLHPGTYYKSVRIITNDDLPLIISRDIYYRIDTAENGRGEQYTRASTTDKGVMGRSFLLLLKEGVPRFRQEEPGLRESIGEFRIHYNAVASRHDMDSLGIRNYADLKKDDVDYIDIIADSDAKIWFKMGR